jgi:hypothetical protein
MLAGMFGGVLEATAIGLLAGVSVLCLGQQLTLGPWRTGTGAVAFAILTALVVADFSVDGAGAWWAAHPTAEAAAAGLLLLALTVLVVEAAVNRALIKSEARRWRPAAAFAASAVLDRAIEPLRGVEGDLSSVSAVGRLKTAIRGEWPPSAVNTLRTRIPLRRAELQRAVLEAAAVLTATDELHGLYDELLTAITTLTDLDEAIREWYGTGANEGAFRNEFPPDDAWQTGEALDHGYKNQRPSDDEWELQFPETGAAWRVVMGVWASALSHVLAFECNATDTLGITPTADSPWQTAPV